MTIQLPVIVQGKRATWSIPVDLYRQIVAVSPYQPRRDPWLQDKVFFIDVEGGEYRVLEMLGRFPSRRTLRCSARRDKIARNKDMTLRCRRG